MKKKNGFTLVELLAVVVILGIIIAISIPAVSKWIDRSRNESDESQKKTLLMASQSYAQENVKILPKVIGQTITVTAEELKTAQYLKTDLVNSKKKSCMDSYVKIRKTNQKLYDYKVYYLCEGDSLLVNDSTNNPTISIGFTGSANTVSVAAFKVVITGGTKDGIDLGIDGYSYSISARYNTSDQLVEIYNSGSLSGTGAKSLIIEKSLNDYVDITKVNDFIVSVEAYNTDGGYAKATQSSLYNDSTPPTCGNISGEARHDEDYLTHKGDTRRITIGCIDNENGSGCTKDKFIKTFDTQMEYGTITISDNAGNTRDCPVRVNIDWTAPSFTATAYKYTGNLEALGDRVSEPATVSESTTNHSLTITSSYIDTVNGWLNLANYPKGIEYTITTEDNIRLKDGKLYYNRGGIWDEGAQYDTLQDGEAKNFSVTDNGFKFKMEEEGLRKAKYVVRDKAGNEVSIFFLAKIDRTNPAISINKSHINTEDGVTFTVSCTDYESRCPSSSNTTHTGVKSSTIYTVSDNAGNTSSATGSVTSFNCHPYEAKCGTTPCGTKSKCSYMNSGNCTKDNSVAEGWECRWICEVTKYCDKYCTYYKTCYK